MLLPAFATAAYDNLYFRIKMAAMVLAAINAFVYHRFTERRIVEWDAGSPPDRRPRSRAWFPCASGRRHRRGAADVVHDVLRFGAVPRDNLLSTCEARLSW